MESYFKGREELGKRSLVHQMIKGPRLESLEGGMLGVEELSLRGT